MVRVNKRKGPILQTEFVAKPFMNLTDTFGMDAPPVTPLIEPRLKIPPPTIHE